VQLPFFHLNLRKNPFGSLSRQEQQLLADVDLSEALLFLNNNSINTQRPPAVQFIGRQGSGKTTHLLALLAHFPTAVYSALPVDQPVSVRTDGEPILVDDAQWLPWWTRKLLFRRPTRIVLATHRDYSAELRRVGRAVLTLSAETSTNPDSLHRRLNARIEAVRRGTHEIPVISSEEAAALWNTFGADQRSTIEYLYHVFQTLPRIDAFRHQLLLHPVSSLKHQSLSTCFDP
jgi:hypothetical protein